MSIQDLIEEQQEAKMTVLREQIATLKELATNLASENKEAAKQVATLSAEKIDYLRFDKELVERNVALTTENKVLRE